ncbi:MULTISPECIES: VOC family protein [Rhodomicrobium]|uniref:VOC family protein n=1 Tax=Rhodomicrobium TaxID=1068 RepID=UPI000B4C1FD0|nr:MULTISPECIES: VOC family protein [Rhodomicrobium]
MRSGDEQMRAPGTFLWNELLTNDAEGASAFYSQLFGWQSFNPDGLEDRAVPEPEKSGPPHTIWMMGFTQIGSMRGLPEAHQARSPVWMPFITVNDVDESARQARELGGSVLEEPFNVPNTGRFAILLDPQGAVFGVGKPFLSEAR